MKVYSHFIYWVRSCVVKSTLFMLPFIVVCSGDLFSQKLDSLKKVLASSKEDTNKVNILFSLCSLGEVSDSEKLNNAKYAILLSEKLNFKKGIALGNVFFGIVSNNLGQYQKAKEHLTKAVAIASTMPGNKTILSMAYNSLGANYYSKGDYKEALTYFHKSLKLYEDLKSKRKVADVFHNMSLIYYQNKEYKQAMEYTAKASEAYRMLNDTLGMTLTLAQYGNIAYELFNYDTALVYYKKALYFSERVPDKSYALVPLNGIGGVFSEKKSHKEALEYFKKELELAERIGDQEAAALALTNAGKEYDYLDEYNKAIVTLKKAVTLSKEIGAKRELCIAYSFLSEAYENKKDFKPALEYAFLLLQLKDSLFAEENTGQINELTAKYESEKKEKEIISLNAEVTNSKKDQELLHLKVKEKNVVILSLFAGALLLTVLIFLLFNRQKLKQKNKFQAQINDQQKAMANAVIEVQENERNRIAKELHDSVGTYLSTLKINLQTVESHLPPGKTELLKSSTELIDNTTTELRNITKNLSNEVLQENGLSRALNDLVERINRTGLIRFNLVVHGLNKKIENIIEVNLYRIAQELINNCIKHSKATEITMQLIDHEITIMLLLEDNGIGFNPEDWRSGTGMGLRNIKNRVEFLRGTLKIESMPGKGSTFVIEVPKSMT